jgi:Ran GTPase-activating protein (RanGAP) involved in mRNA processing and transport
MEALARKLHNHSTLQEIDVSHNPICAPALQKLNSALSTCSKLRRVEMQGMWFPRVWSTLPHTMMVPESDTLVTLNFSRNAFAFIPHGHGILESFKNCLVSCVNLENLDVSKNFLGHARFESLCEVFPRLPKLSTLNMADMDLMPVSLQTLSNVIPKCLNLTMLDVSKNHMITQLSSEGTMEAIQFKTFVGCLRHCRWLRILNFCNFGFCPISFRLLFENLHRCQALTSLHLKSNKIARIGMDIVTANLPFLTSLKCLDLSANVIEDNHATALLDVMESHACLEDIRLRLNFISVEGRTNVKNRVHSFARPSSVDLKGCDFAYLKFCHKFDDNRHTRYWMDMLVKQLEEMD